MWQVTRDRLHVTGDRWHVTHDKMGVCFLPDSALPTGYISSFPEVVPTSTGQAPRYSVPGSHHFYPHFIVYMSTNNLMNNNDPINFPWMTDELNIILFFKVMFHTHKSSKPIEMMTDYVFMVSLTFHWIGPLGQSVYKLQCPCVFLCVCMYVPSREVPFKCFFAPIYKGPRSNSFWIFGFLREKLRKGSGLRFCNFGSEMV